MKPTLILLFCSILSVNISIIAQSITVQNFDKKIKLAQLIIEKQPAATEIKSILPEGFSLDSANATGYYIKYTDKSQIIAYLYKDTERTVAVGFYENNDAGKEIFEFTESEMKYIFIASEHMCDYYKKGNLSLCFCPGLKEGLMVYFEIFN